jgi:hypothetical protein
VIYVKAEVQSSSSHSPTNDSTQHHDAVPSSGPSRDTHTPDASTSPTPFVVVDRVADKDPPEYSHVEHKPLHEDAAKRTADAEPDFESVQPETPSEKQNVSASPPVPIVVVEETDDSPSHGDDFGKDATSAQKVSHELRAADATPDKVVVSPDPELKPPSPPASVSNTEDDAEFDEQAAPLLRHDTFQSDIAEESSVTESISTKRVVEEKPAVPTTEEQDMPLFRHESVQSEAAENHSAPDRPSTIDVVEEDSGRPLTDQDSSHVGLGTHSKVSQERAENGEADNESLSKLDNGPLMSYEIGLPEEDEEDELVNGPLLSHETGFPGIEVIDDDKIIDEQYDEEFEDDVTYPDDYGSEVPLLPHERDAKEESRDSSEASGGDPTFQYETATDSSIVGNHQYFLNRTSSNSSLPHRLPRSDAEDEDLQDPSLERFPTNREQILERVATISTHLPVDETRVSPNSPEFSAKSQACSSADLRANTSHTSLKPVDEEEDLEEEDSNESGSEKDDHFTMEAQTRKTAETTGTNGIGPEASARSLSSSEAESVQKNDGANDSSKRLGTVYGSITTPAAILNPLTPPLTPERKALKSNDTSPASEDSRDTEETSLKPRTDVSLTPSSALDPASQKENLLRTLVNFLTACFGGRKQAR